VRYYIIRIIDETGTAQDAFAARTMKEAYTIKDMFQMWMPEPNYFVDEFDGSLEAGLTWAMADALPDEEKDSETYAIFWKKFTAYFFPPKQIL
jgi:hypothetical protein